MNFITRENWNATTEPSTRVRLAAELGVDGCTIFRAVLRCAVRVRRMGLVFPRHQDAVDMALVTAKGALENPTSPSQMQAMWAASAVLREQAEALRGWERGSCGHSALHCIRRLTVSGPVFEAWPEGPSDYTLSVLHACECIGTQRILAELDRLLPWEATLEAKILRALRLHATDRVTQGEDVGITLAQWLAQRRPPRGTWVQDAEELIDRVRWDEAPDVFASLYALVREEKAS